MAAALEGDHHAFAELIKAHHLPLMSHLNRLVGPVAADDVAQETLVRVWSALERFDCSRSFRTWLLVIASREGFRHLRTQSPHRLPTLDECDGISDTASPEEATIAAETSAQERTQLEQAIASLPVKARTLYELRYRQNLPISELSEHFGVTTSALKVRLHRMREHLKQYIDTEETNDD